MASERSVEKQVQLKRKIHDIVKASMTPDEYMTVDPSAVVSEDMPLIKLADTTMGAKRERQMLQQANTEKLQKLLKAKTEKQKKKKKMEQQKMERSSSSSSQDDHEEGHEQEQPCASSLRTGK